MAKPPAKIVAATADRKVPTSYRIWLSVRQAFGAAAKLQGKSAEELAEELFRQEAIRMKTLREPTNGKARIRPANEGASQV